MTFYCSSRMPPGRIPDAQNHSSRAFFVVLKPTLKLRMYSMFVAAATLREYPIAFAFPGIQFICTIRFSSVPPMNHRLFLQGGQPALRSLWNRGFSRHLDDHSLWPQEIRSELRTHPKLPAELLPLCSDVVPSVPLFQ